MLGDTCRRYPVFQIHRGRGFRHAFEHLPVPRSPHSLKASSLKGKVASVLVFCVVRRRHQPPSGASQMFSPTQGYDVAYA